MSKAVRKAAGFVIYRKNCDEIIEYLLMQASYANYHWTPPKGISNISQRNILFYSIVLF